jgi:hypothetical protein
MTNKESVDAVSKNYSIQVCRFHLNVNTHVKLPKQQRLRKLHIAFHPNRIHSQREFFEINLEQAIAILQLLDKSKDITSEIVEEINNDLTEVDKVAGRKMNIIRCMPINYI